MLTFAEAEKRIEDFLTGQMPQALRAVDYELPSFDAESGETDLQTAARAQVEIRHVRGAADAAYLVQAFGDELLMQLQLNVHRLVAVYRVPALDALDASTLADRRRTRRLAIRLARCSDYARSGAALCRNLLLRFCRPRFSRKRAAAALLAHRYCADDPLLHARSGTHRHRAIAAPCRFSGVSMPSSVR